MHRTRIAVLSVFLVATCLGLFVAATADAQVSTSFNGTQNGSQIFTGFFLPQRFAVSASNGTGSGGQKLLIVGTVVGDLNGSTVGQVSGPTSFIMTEVPLVITGIQVTGPSGVTGGGAAQGCSALQLQTNATTLAFGVSSVSNSGETIVLERHGNNATFHNSLCNIRSLINSTRNQNRAALAAALNTWFLTNFNLSSSGR